MLGAIGCLSISSIMVSGGCLVVYDIGAGQALEVGCWTLDIEEEMMGMSKKIWKRKETLHIPNKEQKFPGPTMTLEEHDFLTRTLRSASTQCCYWTVYNKHISQQASQDI